MNEKKIITKTEAQTLIMDAGKEWEDFKEYADGLEENGGYDLSTVMRYINR